MPTVLRVTCAVVLIIGLPLIIGIGTYMSGVTTNITAALIMSWMIASYAGAMLTKAALDKGSSFLQLHFWIFVYCWIGLAGSAQIATGIFPWASSLQTDANLEITLAVIAGGIATYELSLHRAKVRHRAAKRPPRLANPKLGHFVLVTILCMAASIWSIYDQGGISAVLLTRGQVDHQFGVNLAQKSDRLIQQTLQHMPPIVAALVGLYMIKAIPSGRLGRALVLILLGALLCLNAVANYIPSLNRITLGFIVTSSATLILFYKPRYKLPYTLAMVVGLVLLFPYADYFRYEKGYSASDVKGPVEMLTTKGDYDVLQMIGNAVSIANEDGVDNGYHIVGSVLFFVPRQAWTTKPYGTGQTIGEHLGYSNTNLSAPLWAELYFAAGPLAVLLGFWGLGSITHRIEKLGAPQSGPGPLVIAYAAGFQIFILRGDLMNGIAYSLPGAAILLLFLITMPKSTNDSRARTKRA